MKKEPAKKIPVKTFIKEANNILSGIIYSRMKLKKKVQELRIARTKINHALKKLKSDIGD